MFSPAYPNSLPAHARPAAKSQGGTLPAGARVNVYFIIESEVAPELCEGAPPTLVYIAGAESRASLKLLEGAGEPRRQSAHPRSRSMGTTCLSRAKNHRYPSRLANNTPALCAPEEIARYYGDNGSFSRLIRPYAVFATLSCTRSTCRARRVRWCRSEKGPSYTTRKYSPANCRVNIKYRSRALL